MTQYRLSTFDLPTLRRHTIGFDRLFNELNRTFEGSKADNYPPHNVLQTGENTYMVELAVTGFNETELSVVLKDKVLRVEGTHDVDHEEAASAVEFIHRGLAQRNFVKEWTLPEHMEVQSVRVRNGIMFIALEQLIPEEQKPKSIAITFE